jgi:hypothetical protein
MTRIKKRIDSFLYDTQGYSTQLIATAREEALYRTEHTPVWGTFQMFLAGVDGDGEEYITLIRLLEAVEWIRRTQENPEKLIESVSGAYILLPEDPLAGCTYCRDFLPGGEPSEPYFRDAHGERIDDVDTIRTLRERFAARIESERCNDTQRQHSGNSGGLDMSQSANSTLAADSKS